MHACLAAGLRAQAKADQKKPSSKSLFPFHAVLSQSIHKALHVQSAPTSRSDAGRQAGRLLRLLAIHILAGADLASCHQNERVLSPRLHDRVARPKPRPKRLSLSHLIPELGLACQTRACNECAQLVSKSGRPGAHEHDNGLVCGEAAVTLCDAACLSCGRRRCRRTSRVESRQKDS